MGAALKEAQKIEQRLNDQRKRNNTVSQSQFKGIDMTKQMPVSVPLYQINIDGKLSYIDVSINGKDYLGLVDSGCLISCINKETAEKLELAVDTTSAVGRTADGKSIEFAGTTEINLKMGKTLITTKVMVMRQSNTSFIYGKDLFNMLEAQIDFKTKEFIFGSAVLKLKELKDEDLETENSKESGNGATTDIQQSSEKEKTVKMKLCLKDLELNEKLCLISILPTFSAERDNNFELFIETLELKLAASDIMEEEKAEILLLCLDKRAAQTLTLIRKQQPILSWQEIILILGNQLNNNSGISYSAMCKTRQKKNETFEEFAREISKKVNEFT
uniref:Uncharacterized protein n=1 Tax=Panagrolaimus davidi TaxID=227884 RepID=A0A914R5L3_9BILA